MSYCVKCKHDCYEWERYCSDCIHELEMRKIGRLEQSITRLFAKSGIDYNEFKTLIEGEQI